jgi:hypothetical protein
MDKITHIPKKIVVNGKEKTVYARTAQTEKELDRHRMGFFAGVDSLPLKSFGDKLKEKQLIILAPYQTAKSVIRTRMELDKRPHKVFTGTTLLQYYFANDGYRDGFPVFKQFYLLFGFSESTNRRTHEIIVETLFTRYHAENHFWMIIPKNLEAMAAQWGSSLMNLQMFPVLDLRQSQEMEKQGPVSVANPTTSEAVGESVFSKIFRDPSYPEEPDEFSAPSSIRDDPEEERRRKRDYEKMRRKLF